MQRSSKYNFEKWNREIAVDAVWQAVRFTDYTCESASFAGQVYKFARENNLRATVVTFPAFVVFRFYDPNSFMMPNMKAMPLVKELKRQHEEEAAKAWKNTPRR